MINDQHICVNWCLVCAKQIRKCMHACSQSRVNVRVLFIINVSSFCLLKKWRYGFEIFVQKPGYSVLAIEKNCMKLVSVAEKNVGVWFSFSDLILSLCELCKCMWALQALSAQLLSVIIFAHSISRLSVRRQIPHGKDALTGALKDLPSVTQRFCQCHALTPHCRPPFPISCP